MKYLSSTACSLLAIAVAAAPTPNQADVVELSGHSSHHANVERAVDVSIDGKPIHLEGGYIRKTDLNRFGWDVKDREPRSINVEGSKEEAPVDVDGAATRSGWAYIKRDGEGAPVDVDGAATRSGWAYIKRDGEGAPVDVDGAATRSGWAYIKRDGEGAPVDVDGAATRSGWAYIKRDGEGAPVDVDGAATRSGWAYIKRSEERPIGF